jgi:hypothetical protein
MEKPMTSLLEAIPPTSRALIVEELKRRDPDLLQELRTAIEPTNQQSHAIVNLLIDALSENYGPGHIPNERGKAIDDAIADYFLTWPRYG